MADILADYREWRQQQAARVSTHSDGCHMWHEQCMIHRLADALAVEQAKRTASEAEIDALEYVVEEGRIACREDYGILRSWLCRLRTAWESTPSEPSTPGEGTRQAEGIATRLRQTRADMVSPEPPVSGAGKHGETGK